MTTYERIQKHFRKACADYSLLEDADKILVAVSGGKDSLMLVRLLSEQARIYRPQIHVEAAHVVMDNIPYETDRTYLQTFCHEAGIPLHILHTGFDESTDRRKTRCFLCSWCRRKALFRFAEENGFNKVALGHHQDDLIVTYLMNITFEGSASTIRPKMQMEHYPLQVIRPLCMVQEGWIAEVAAAEGFEKQKTPCPYEQSTRRTDMTNIFHQLQTLNPEARYSIIRAILSIP